jgi:hypothetical protein
MMDSILLSEDSHKDLLRVAFYAGWYQGFTEDQTLDELFQEWYDRVIGSDKGIDEERY